MASPTCSFITACCSVIASVVALCTSGPLTVYPLLFCTLALWRSMSTAVMAVYEHANSAPRERKLKRKQQKACYFRLKTIALHDSASGGECLRDAMNNVFIVVCYKSHGGQNRILWSIYNPAAYGWMLAQNYQYFDSWCDIKVQEAWDTQCFLVTTYLCRKLHRNVLPSTVSR